MVFYLHIESDKHTCKRRHGRHDPLSLPFDEEFVIKFLSSFKLVYTCYKFIASGNGEQTSRLKDIFGPDWHGHQRTSTYKQPSSTSLIQDTVHAA